MTVQAPRRTRDRARIDAPIDAAATGGAPRRDEQPTSSPMHAHEQGSTVVPDIKAGMVVFLVAVPLCLGVALASGAPMLSGIVTGVVGGVLVSWLSGSQLMVSGPAAGLTAIVLAAITQLGSFRAFLVAVVIAGLLQIGLRFLRAGIIAYYFPSSVIKGMLAAIGLILILKQIPYALGIGSEVFESDAFAVNGGNTFSVIGDAIAAVHPGVALLSAVSMLLLVMWDKPLLARAKKIVPGPLAVVLLGVGMSALFAAMWPSLAVPAGQLVTLPVPENVGDLASYLTFPDWSALSNPAVYTVAITLAIVASIETLLSLEATDKLDPFKRTASADRELLAQGVGNTLCGLIGGLPMTGVIVRSSANIQAGGRTRKASFFHGLFLLAAVIAGARLLNMIPLATLAAVLIYTGFKLAHPKLFVNAWRAGSKQLAPFVVTVVAILLTDLLVGIAIGLAVGAFFILLNNLRTSYSYHRDESADHHRVDIRLSEDVSFLNKASIRTMLQELPDGAVVTIDGSASTHIDADVVEIIHDFRETAETKNITLRLVAIPEPLTAAANH